MKKILLSFGLIAFIISLYAQDVTYAREVLETLASPDFYGRGYVKKGDGKAAKYLAQEFKKKQLKAFSANYFQFYSFPINTFPGKISVAIDGEELIPGHEYVISSSAPATNQYFKLEDLRSTTSSWDSLLLLMDLPAENTLFLLDDKDMRSYYGRGFPHLKAAALLTPKTPYWHVSNGGKVEETCWLKIREDKVAIGAEGIQIKVKNKFISDYKTQNVIAYVAGKTHPNQYMVFTAHYDHLGMMGNETYYNGANDNASGTAMLLDLARHYSLPENQPEESVVFMALSGEETGLHGSSYFAENPLFPLENIKALVNLDMVGSGSEGITVVNATVLPEIFQCLDGINQKSNYLTEVKSRGESCNSDHCPFYQKGVPAIFIYTRGKETQEYHTVTDVAQGYPFTAYDGLFRLLTDFVSTYKVPQ